MTGSGDPVFDAEGRHRLGRRFGPAVDPWFDALPGRVRELGALISRGSVSVVMWCRGEDGTPLVLEVSDPAAVSREAPDSAARRCFS